MSSVKPITLASVTKLEPGETIWDSRITGFGCRCQKRFKSFIVKYRTKEGRQRLYTIGKFGPWTPDQARDEARQILADVGKGLDPAASKLLNRSLPTIQGAFPSYLAEVQAKRKEKTFYEYSRLFERYIQPGLGTLRVDAIGRGDIVPLHQRLKSSPYQANRVLALLSSFFTWCERQNLRELNSNPCKHIEAYREKNRQRFLSSEELQSLSLALEDADTRRPDWLYVTAALRLLLFTGARCSEILTLKWEYIDWIAQVARLPDSKTGEKTIYLSEESIALLKILPRLEGNPYVIPGKKPGTHLVNIKDPWIVIRGDAGLNDVRIHDLRHTFASIGVGAGLSLPIVGALLGHKSPRTTQGYAHLAHSPLQLATSTVGASLKALTARSPND